MHTRNLLLASLLVALYGCQPETPAQQSAVPAPVTEPVAASAPVEPAAMTPVPATESASVAKPTSAVQEKPVAVKDMPAPAVKPAPIQAVVVPPVKVEPAPAIKPESKPVAAMSDADVLQLAKKNGCLVCHAIDRKVVGPAWKAVAAKYRGDAGAEARLMDKISKGGGGVWGSIAMPSNPKLGEADRQALARFVLSLK